MASLQLHSSGVEVIDALIDGVRVGDNLVVLLGGGASGEWLVDRCVAAAEPGRLIVADGTGRLGGDVGGGAVLDWGAGKTTPDRARAELDRADERAGEGAAFVVDSLSSLAAAWGDQAALDLFMWACPRLFRRRSVAMWLLDRDQHDDAFVHRLTTVTQVVVSVRPDDGRLHIEVVKAAGRDASVVGRAVVARLVDGVLVGAHPVGTERQRLGAHLRDLRVRHGVGQADLARRVGISPSALSQAERGVRAVSAETLLRIWRTLGEPVDLDARGYRLHRRNRHPSTTVAAGVEGHRRSDSPTVWHLTFRAGASGRGSLFPVKATETILVLHGVLEVVFDGVVEVLHEGDTLVADTAALTGWTNPSDTDAEALWLF